MRGHQISILEPDQNDCVFGVVFCYFLVNTTTFLGAILPP